MIHGPARKMEARGVWVRLGALTAIAIAALALRLIEPGTLSWLPLRTSCGAVSGLPCIFCGCTRAMHHLLNGDPWRALYFNWLAFPVAAILLTVWVKLAMEVILRRRVRVPLPRLQLTPRLVATACAAIFALWILQVSLAIRGNKHELLNPRGPLYSVLWR